MLEALRSGPALPTPSYGEGDQGAARLGLSRGGSVGSADKDKESDGLGSSLLTSSPPVGRTSFAQVTLMGGNFPTLQQQQQGMPGSSSSSVAGSCTVWGTPRPSPAASAASTPPSGEAPLFAGGSSNKGQKGKPGSGSGSGSRKAEISLLSNSIARNYR